MLCNERGFGDLIAQALEVIGVTEQRVNDWLGDCKCQERREKLNQLGNWATRVMTGHVQHAKDYFSAIVHD